MERLRTLCTKILHNRDNPGLGEETEEDCRQRKSVVIFVVLTAQKSSEGTDFD